MYDDIKMMEEMLSRLVFNLHDLKTFILGADVNVKANANTTPSSECLRDDFKNNISTLSCALTELDVITDAIKGGNK